MPRPVGADRRRHRQRACCEVRGDPQPAHVHARHRLQPHALPDPGGARVVAVGVGVPRGLLAAGLYAVPAVAGAHHDPDGLPARSPRSAVKEEKPPRCRVTSTPSAHTVASWSTAPKCSSTRRPDHSAGTAMSRAYQTASRKSVSPIPDAADSGANGTVISPASGRSSRPRSRPVSPWSISNSHCPFSVSQSGRTHVGRGCSGERGTSVTSRSFLTGHGSPRRRETSPSRSRAVNPRHRWLNTVGGPRDDVLMSDTIGPPPPGPAGWTDLAGGPGADRTWRLGAEAVHDHARRSSTWLGV